MKIDYLKEGSRDCPLIRLTAFQNEEIVQLCSLCSALALGVARNIHLQNYSWVELIGGIELVLRRANTDKGIQEPDMGYQFTLDLTAEAWLEIEGKLEPFIKDRTGYQWLSEQGPISLLISANGSW